MLLSYLNNKKHCLKMARSKTKSSKKNIKRSGRISRPKVTTIRNSIATNMTNVTNNYLSYEDLWKIYHADRMDQPRRCRNILQAMIGYEIIKGVRRVRKYNNISTERFWKRTEDCVNSIDLRTIPEAPPHFYEYLHYLYLMKVGPSINKLSKNLRQKQMEEEVAGQLMSMKES